MKGSLIDSVLRTGAITIVFQPAFEMDDSADQSPSVHFLECLSRGPKGTNMESAGVLFEYARRKGREMALDLVCIDAAFRAVSESGQRPVISVNVHASTLEREPDFPAFLAGLADDHDILLSNVILEIVEHGPDWCGPMLTRVLRKLRDLGVRIALDDIGLGQSNFRMILDCRPDYFKLDRYLIQGCHADPTRSALLDSLTLLANRMNARVVAEGVETSNDLLEVMRRGIDLIQGFLLAKPSSFEELRPFLDSGRKLREPAGHPERPEAWKRELVS